MQNKYLNMGILHISWLQLSGKIFFFSRKYDVTLRRKMKEDISQKKYTEIWYLLQIFWKYGLFKKDCAGTWYFLYHLERRYFFPENVVFFPWTESERGVIFLKKYTETWYFLIDMPPCKKKNQRRSYAAKIHLKVIGILDRHPRKSSSNFLYLHGDLYKRFHILLSSKKTGHVTHRIEVWLLLQFIWLEIFYNE